MTDLLIKKKGSIHGIGIFTEINIKKNAVFYEVPMEFISNEPKPKWAYIGKNRWILVPVLLLQRLGRYA